MLKPHSDLVWVDDTGGLRMYDARTGEFLELSDSAAEIWRLLIAGNDVDAVIKELGRIYDARTPEDRQRVRSDVETFVADLVAADLLVDDALVSVPTTSAPRGERG